MLNITSGRFKNFVNHYDKCLHLNRDYVQKQCKDVVFNYVNSLLKDVFLLRYIYIKYAC